MDAGVLGLVSSLIDQDNIIAALLFFLLYLIIAKQRKTTGESRDKDTNELRNDIKELKEEISKQKTRNELFSKEISYMKEHMSATEQSINDIKGSLRNMEITMTQIATIVNALAEKAIKVEIKDK